jgi:polar amino acid transport system substrate-binding protein
MKRIIAVCILILFAAGTVITASAADKKIVVVVDRHYPPYTYGTAERAKGLYTGLIEEAFTRMGREVEIRALPWKQALKEGREGRAAVGGIYKNSVRLKIYDYSRPFFEERLSVYVKRGKAFRFSRLSDLQGKVIGLNHAWSYGDEFDAARKKYHFVTEEVLSNAQNFRKLVAGKIDCLVADEIAASHIIRQEHLSDQVEKLEMPAAVNKAYLAFAKRLNKKDLLEKFNRTLEEMKKDGSYRRIVEHFIAASK